VSIDVERDGGVAVLTVNRPDALNALDSTTLTELASRLDDVADDRDVRVLVLTGAGDRAFIAGADIKEMSAKRVLEAQQYAFLGQRCGLMLERMWKPSIAAINGFALGGGLELALACDLRFASSTAKLGQPEINLGLIPGWGGTQRVARVAGVALAKDLILTGRTIDASEAERRGLVNAVYEPGELMERALDAARVLASKSAVALAHAKEVCNTALQGEHRANLDHEATIFALLFSTEDAREGMAAFVEKREPKFEGR
jgi:enoyl-CoA hydratase